MVTYVLAGVFVAVFAQLHFNAGSAEGGEYEPALERARELYEQSPFIQLDGRDRALLGDDFVDVIQAAHAADQERGMAPRFSQRMRGRTQERFEVAAEKAYQAKLREYPSWRLGVAPGGGLGTGLFTHVVAHETVLAVSIAMIALVLAGVGLEMAYGSFVFGALCLMGTLIPAALYATLDGRSGVPFHGASGLLGTLLGAYLIRSFGGGFVLPGWLLLPVWVFTDVFFVRGHWVDDWQEAPLATLGASVCLGVVIAVLLQALGVERRLVERAEASDAADVDRVILRAKRAVEAGNVEGMVDDILDVQRHNEGHRELAEVTWDVARLGGGAERALPIALKLLRDQLKRGVTDRAVLLWQQIEGACPAYQAEVTLLIRMGEALLDESHPEAALEVLTRAVDREDRLAPALAQRVVRVARDLDPVLTGRAASLALADPALEDAARASLQALASAVAAGIGSPPSAPPQPAPTPASTQAPTTSESTRYPAESDIDLENDADLMDPEVFAELDAAAEGGGEAGSDELDPNALSIESIAREFSSNLGLAAEACEAPEQWNDPGVISDLSGEPQAGGSADLQSPGSAGAHLDNSHLEAGALSLDGLSGGADARGGPVEEASDASPSLPPLTSSPAPAPAAPASDAPSLPPLRAPTSELAAAPGSALLGTDTTEPLSPETGDFAGGIEPEPLAQTGLRPLKLIEGVPLQVEDEAIEVEVDDRGKSRVPFSRVDAVAVAAVGGLSAKPVLVIDLVLNWMAVGGEPLKVIRLCSHRFNPRQLDPSAATPLDALKRLVARVIERSGATPLPDATAVKGEPFDRFDDVTAYQRQVLLAE